MSRKKRGRTEGVAVAPYTSLEIIGGGGKKGNGNKGTFLLILYLYLFFAGMAFAFISMAELPVYQGRVVLFCTAAAVAFGGAAFGMEHKGIFYFISFLTIGGIGIAGRHTLLYGFRIIANRVIAEINRYYNGNIEMYAVNDKDTGACTLSFCFGMILLIWLISVVMGYWARKWILGVLIVYILWAGLLIGRVPSMSSLGMLVISYCGMSAVISARNMPVYQEDKNFGTGKGGLCMGLLACLLLMIAALVLTPVLSPKVLKHQKAVYYAVNRIEQQVLSGDFKDWNLFANASLPFYSSSGMLDNREIKYKGEDELIVVAEKRPEKDLYLRGFVGDEYMGSRWNRIAGRDNSRSHKIQNISYQALEQAASAGETLEEENLQLQFLQADSSLGYVPYYSYIPDSTKVEGDGAVQGSSGDIQEYQGFYRDYSQLAAVTSPDTSESAEAEYRAFVYEQYTLVPKEGVERLVSQCRQQDLTDPEEVTDYIRSVLHGTTSYSLTLDKLPRGEDFAEYFLYKQRKGYCIHYATTAALMYRIFGIPARYVTGYIVPQNHFTEKDGSYQAVVKDDKSHAWVEIYLDGRGWMPVEMTPGYLPSEEGQEIPGLQDNLPEEGQDGRGDTPREEIPDPPEDAKTGGKDAVEPDSAQKRGQTDVKEGAVDRFWNGITKGMSPSAGRTVRYLGTTLGILFLFCLLILFRRWIMVSRQLRLFGSWSTNLAIVRISHSLYQMLSEAGYDQGEAMWDLQWAAYVQKQLPCLKEGEMTEFMAIAQKAAFGNEKRPRQELIDARKMYRRISRYLYKRQGRWKRLYWKYIKCR